MAVRTTDRAGKEDFPLPANKLTPPEHPKFDFDAFPPDTLFHDRRTGADRRGPAKGDALRPDAPERRIRRERRRRVDPTTFEKQYTPDEIEFMTAMQEFKVLSGKPFPTHRDVLKVTMSLGYRKVANEAVPSGQDPENPDPAPRSPR
jgi:hypothetical protein